MRRISGGRSRPRLARLALALAAAALVFAAPARAHDVSYAHVRLDWRPDRVDVALTMHQDDAAFVLRVPMPEWLLRDDVIARAGPALHDSLAGRLRILADGVPIAWQLQAARRDPRGRGVELTGSAPLARPAATLEVHGPVFAQVANHQTFVTVFRDARLVREDVLTDEHRMARVYSGGTPGALAVLRTFVPAGIHHIAIGPDHILFVLGLLLLGGGVLALLKVVTAFTLAHSLTLTLAALGLVRLPSRLVEPVIALSIVAVALETLRARARQEDRRAAIAFGFGLIHGFGFASVLAEFGLPREALGWSLAGFNLGVELGQAVIVLLVAPLLALLERSRPAVHAKVVTAAALGIAAAGGYWFVERLVRGG